MTVYIIGMEDTNYFKIGYTIADAESRLRDIQTGNPRKLYVYAEIPGSRELEKKLHASRHIQDGLEWMTLCSCWVRLRSCKSNLPTSTIVAQGASTGVFTRGEGAKMTECNHTVFNWDKQSDGLWKCRGCGESFQRDVKPGDVYQGVCCEGFEWEVILIIIDVWGKCKNPDCPGVCCPGDLECPWRGVKSFPSEELEEFLR